jgi:prepilin-type N-terminal cleavage/methylation domain-containing protein
MTKNKKGFTIIEVVLVLAIAGLIFLMVFIALPALQRSQRNTQRKDDISRIITAINDYQSNNSGKSPFKSVDSGDIKDKNGNANVVKFISRYIEGDASIQNPFDSHPQFSDPNGESYTFTIHKGSSGNGNGTGITSTDVDNVIHVFKYAGCGADENTYNYSAGGSDVALFYVMEGGQVLCNDNH